MNCSVIISHADALENVARSLGLPLSIADINDHTDALIAQSIRRSVFIAAPCNIRTARTLVIAALAPLLDDIEARVNDMIEDLIAIGDLLEMRSESDEGSDILLRPAPPAFVRRKDNTFIILGISGDEITPIDNQSVIYTPSGLRTFPTSDPTNYRDMFIDLGLIEIPEHIWLHAPAKISVEDYLDSWVRSLPSVKHPENIEGLEIIDTKIPASFYKDRWAKLSNEHSGIYVGRRPQRYGANLWCLFEIKNGLIERFVDIYSKDARIRNCDEAWRIQAALDSKELRSQKIRILSDQKNIILSFSSPIPAWAIRRLSMIGARKIVKGSLIAFEIPAQNAENEICWLEDMLWLARDIKENV